MVTGNLSIFFAVRKGENAIFCNFRGKRRSTTVRDGTFEGNGHSISDFNVPKSGGVVIPACSIFSSLGQKAKIQNVSFLDVTYVMTGISEAATKVKYAALAVSSDNATLENVTIEGEIHTNVADKIEDLNDLFYEESGSEKLTGVTVNVTVAPLEESPAVTVD